MKFMTFNPKFGNSNIMVNIFSSCSPFSYSYNEVSKYKLLPPFQKERSRSVSYDKAPNYFCVNSNIDLLIFFR